MLTSLAGNNVSQRAFTLIEVLVVLVILAMVMAIVVPAMSKGRGDSLSSVARDLQVGLRQARSAAVLTQKDQSFLVDVEAREYWQSGSGSKDAIPREFKITASVATSELRNSTAGIRFFPDGSSTGGFLRVSTGQAALRVAVDWLTGRVSVHEESQP